MKRSVSSLVGTFTGLGADINGYERFRDRCRHHDRGGFPIQMKIKLPQNGKWLESNTPQLKVIPYTLIFDDASRTRKASPSSPSLLRSPVARPESICACFSIICRIYFSLSFFSILARIISIGSPNIDISVTDSISKPVSSRTLGANIGRQSAYCGNFSCAHS